MNKDESDRIETLRDAWEQGLLKKALARAPERRPAFTTTSGIPLERVYTPLHLADQDYERDLGFPGAYPFTRGVQPTMYRGRFWTMRQYAGFGSAEETNHRFKYLLEQGQTGLSVAFDLPTQMGYDSDDPLVAGEVGKVGVAVDSLADMERLFQGIPLGKVSTSMTINSTASILLCMYIAVAEAQGVPRDQLTGTIQNDILKEYVARGTYIFPPAPSMRLITDTFAFCAAELPRWNSISISGYHIREAGSTAVQEVAFTLADAIAYVEAAVKAGLDVDRIGPQLAFFFNAHNHLLEEVAKYRAARRLWGRIMRERFGAKDPRSWMLRFHAQTAGSTLTAQQAENNVVRVAVQALAAVLGGAQSLHTNSRDEALGLPTEEAVRIALRTQQILAHESGVAEVADPLGGLLRRRSADEPRRGGGPGLSRQDRPHGRDAAGDRDGLHPEGDPGSRLPGPAGAGREAADRGGRQRFRQRGSGPRPGLRDGRAAGPGAVRAASRCPRPPGRRRRPGCAAGTEGGRDRRRQPLPPHPGCRPGLHHRRGDLRYAAARLRCPPGNGGAVGGANSHLRHNAKRTTDNEKPGNVFHCL